MEKMRVYLDHAATTPIAQEAAAAMLEAMRLAPCNPSAAYAEAAAPRRIMRQCRTLLADMLGCDSTDLTFVSGGTEANNQVLRSFAGSHAVVAAIEHSSVLESAKSCDTTLVLPDATGYVSPDAIERAIRPDTRLICLQWANNETGVLQPVAEVYAIARRRRIHLHVDAVQAFGHVPVRCLCDSMAISAHKLNGPRGIGALYVRPGAAVAPLMVGGGQENGLRSGTENVPAIAGFRAAAALASSDMADCAARHEAMMADFLARIRASRPDMALLGDERPRLPGIAAIRLPGVDAEQAIAALDLMGVMVSGGAACAARTHQPSHVYTAMGLTPAAARQVLRISLGRDTTPAELRYAAQCIAGL